MFIIDTIKFAKLYNNVIIPSKRDEDAGYDIYAYFKEDYIIIPPHETKMIPTGLISAFDKKYVGELKERGSTGTKGIGQRCGVIDSGYRNEWLVPITNHNSNKYIIISKISFEDFCKKYGEENRFGEIILYENNHVIYLTIYNSVTQEIVPSSRVIFYPYSKAICQLLIREVPELKTEICTVEEIKSISSKRGNGKLGSSGK